jgi:ribosome maturation protein Sdo1
VVPDKYALSHHEVRKHCIAMSHISSVHHLLLKGCAGLQFSSTAEKASALKAKLEEVASIIVANTVNPTAHVPFPIEKIRETLQRIRFNDKFSLDKDTKEQVTLGPDCTENCGSVLCDVRLRDKHPLPRVCKP